MIGEQQEIGFPLPQRRHEDREHVQPVVEVLAERAVLDRLLEVLVGGGDEAHVGFQGLGAAEPLVLAFLQHAQQLDLRRKGGCRRFRRGTACPLRRARSAPSSAVVRR